MDTHKGKDMADDIKRLRREVRKRIRKGQPVKAKRARRALRAAKREIR